ncbi:MAG: hypothetical protein SFV55_12180 [Haliscomenobacter sp.]|uniref:hypothetical protein n=1 Tax=Haliscomenobacter sp. TaxID=2717303 RepID=UPI0029B0D6C9|nr:hypothetical protein [Haliscomenobacter sp.]MDX2069172.1 hypothetical protein [Haliscomenobacter sp.]
MKRFIGLGLLATIGLAQVSAQEKTQIEINGTADLEHIVGGMSSHYYLNGIHKDLKSGAVRPLELNLLSKIRFNPQWSANFRLQMERDEGLKFNQVRLAQANVQWAPKESPWLFTVGRFVSPFGLFANQQLSTARTFVDVPLAYGYFINISEQLGQVDRLGNGTQIPINGRNEWGIPLQYYNGYSNGLKARWTIKPGKSSLEFALTTASPNLPRNFNFDPLNYGVMARLKLQPTYFWKQGFSGSFGKFLQNHPLNEQLVDRTGYQQALFGTDFVLGAGHFEWSGELTAGFYRVPEYSPGSKQYTPRNHHFKGFSAWMDTKYEFPFLVGTYAAWRIETLQFSDDWDQAVLRNSLVLGAKIKNFILLRSAYCFQSVQNSNQTGYNAWRTTLTLYF